MLSVTAWLRNTTTQNNLKLNVIALCASFSNTIIHCRVSRPCIIYDSEVFRPLEISQAVFVEFRLKYFAEFQFIVFCCDDLPAKLAENVAQT